MTTDASQLRQAPPGTDSPTENAASDQTRSAPSQLNRASQTVGDRAEPAAFHRPQLGGPWLPAGWRAVVLAALALLFLGSGLYQAAHDSPTVDEGVDVSSGVTGLVRHDLRLSPEHPILPKVLASLPALFAHPIVPETKAYRNGDWFGYSDDFISANRSAGRLQEVLFWSRVVPLLEGVGCALLMYGLASRLFGANAGLLAGGLWLTTPVVVGLSHFAMIDVPFTLAALGTAATLLHFLDRPSDRRAVWVGAAVSAALATRHTALVLLAIALVVVAYALRADRRRAVRAAVVVTVVALAGLWAVYRLLGTPPSGAVAARFNGLVGVAEQRSFLDRAVLALPTPPEWRAGFAYLVYTSNARPAYLLGQAWEGSRWWYYPISSLVKLPLGAVLMLFAAPLGWIGLNRETRRRGVATVVLPGAALFAFVFAQPLNLGLRLALPTVAFGMVAAGAVVRVLQGKWATVIVGALAITQVAALVAATPHALAWMPPPFRPAYQWVSDSNVDFGQDLFALARWSRGKHPWVAVAATRGFAPPPGSRKLVGASPGNVTGWVAVGATTLTELHRKDLAWLHAYCPVADINGSILLYRFDRPPSSKPGPIRPVGPCYSQRFSTRRA